MHIEMHSETDTTLLAAVQASGKDISEIKTKVAVLEERSQRWSHVDARGQSPDRVAARDRCATLDEVGRPGTPTWTTYAEPWVRVTQPRGQEFFTNANPVQGRQPAVFRFRYVAGIQGHPSGCGGTDSHYDIHGVVDEGGDHRWVELHTSAAV